MIPKGVKVLCFDTLLQVFLLEELPAAEDDLLLPKGESGVRGLADVCAEMGLGQACALPSG